MVFIGVVSKWYWSGTEFFEFLFRYVAVLGGMCFCRFLCEVVWSGIEVVLKWCWSGMCFSILRY